MAIEAIALLRIEGFRPPSSSVRVTPLEDGVLLHTGAPFASEPEELVARVRELIGDALAAHVDPRGVFFIPDVASPTARHYEALVEEVGEGGMWGPPWSELEAQSAGGGLEAMFGGMLGQLPAGLLDSVTQAAARGDMGSLQDLALQMQAHMGADPALRDAATQMQAQVQAMLGASPALMGMAEELARAMHSSTPETVRPGASDKPVAPTASQAEQMLAGLGPDAAGLAQMLGGAGIDLGSPELRALMTNMQAQLAQNPAMLSSLAERLFGAMGEGPAEGDEDDEEER